MAHVVVEVGSNLVESVITRRSAEEMHLKVGDTVAAGKAFGTIESVKTLSDLFSPVNGKIVKINGELESKPELVNDDCYGKGWMIVIAPREAGEKDKLLSPAAYRDLLKSIDH